MFTICQNENRHLSYDARTSQLRLNGRRVEREEELETHELIAASCTLGAPIETILDAFDVAR